MSEENHVREQQERLRKLVTNARSALFDEFDAKLSDTDWDDLDMFMGAICARLIENYTLQCALYVQMAPEPDGGLFGMIAKAQLLQIGLSAAVEASVLSAHYSALIAEPRGTRRNGVSAHLRAMRHICDTEHVVQMGLEEYLRAASGMPRPS